MAQQPKSKRFDMRMDPEFERAIDELRSIMRPIPSKSELVRQCVFEKLEREKRRWEK